MATSYLGSDIDWNYYTEPDEHACLNQAGGRCKWPRGKVLGGTSVINGMMYIRCNHEDYDGWENMGNPGWSYDKVYPYFLKSEDNQQIDAVGREYHATGGPMPVSWWPYSPPMAQYILQGGRELGNILSVSLPYRNNISFVFGPGFAVQDLNGANATGFTIGQMHAKNGIRFSAARAYVRPAAKRPNLHVWLRTMVSRVIIDPESKIVTAVEAIDRNNNVITVGVRKEAIVSGGSINSPQILLLSGVGPKADLDEVRNVLNMPVGNGMKLTYFNVLIILRMNELYYEFTHTGKRIVVICIHNQLSIRQVGVQTIVDLPGVGKNLHNHVTYDLYFDLNEPDTEALNWETSTEYLLYRNGIMASTGMSQVMGKWPGPFSEDPNVVDTQLFFTGYQAMCSKTGDIRELRSNESQYIKMSPVVLHPKSRGEIKLASSNPFVYPKIYARYLTEDHDLKVLREAVRMALRLSKTDALRRYNLQLRKNVCKDLIFDTDDYWECELRQNNGPENHQAGSCKMGPETDPLSVVTSELRVSYLLKVMIS